MESKYIEHYLVVAGIAILLAIILVVVSTDAAPIEEWNKTFGGTTIDIAYSVQQTSDGGYVLAGMTYSSKKAAYEALKGDAWLIKTDANGNQQWNRIFVETSVRSVQQTSDGGYIFAGDKLVKTDTNGNQQWSKTFEELLEYSKDAYSIQRTSEGKIIVTASPRPSVSAETVQQTSDGGYILGGVIQKDDDMGDALLVKVDSNGNKVWNKTFGGSKGDGAFSVQQTLDSGFIIAGYTTSYGFGGGDDVWLVKTDARGNKIWDKTLGGKLGGSAYSVKQTLDGGYILAGETNPYGASSFDFWVVKTDASGNRQWNKTFGGTMDEWAFSVQQTLDGGYIIAGFTRSYGGGNSDAWLVKTDASGNEIWNKTFGRTLDDGAYSIQQTSDGGYILAGYTKSYGAGDRDAWLIKVSNEISSIPAEKPVPLTNTTNMLPVTPKPSETFIPESTKIVENGVKTTPKETLEPRETPAFEAILSLLILLISVYRIKRKST